MRPRMNPKRQKMIDETIEKITSIDNPTVPYDGPFQFYTEKEAKALERQRKANLAEQQRNRIAQAKARAAKQIDWHVIERFIGYGDIEAPVVFVGMEEGLGDVNHLEDDLRYRSTFEPVMDVRQAHLGLEKGPELFGIHPRSQRTWWVASDLMMHFEGHLPTDKDQRAALRKRYRTTLLGSELGDSLLVELLPYPHPSKRDWLYRAYKFKTREAYETSVIVDRLKLLGDAIGKYPRKAIICYGLANWKWFKRLFPDDTKWTVDGAFECAFWNGAKVTLSRHFVARRFNTDAGLDQLAAVALP
jgi:hypothetical protein